MSNLKPAEQKRREGNPGHRPIPQPRLVGGRVHEGEKLPVPRHFSAPMRSVWTVAIADLAAGGILDRADLFTVEMFCVQLGRAREIRKYLAGLQTKEQPFGHLLAETARGHASANPLLGVERGAITEARQLADHLGLSASARTRLGLDARGNLGTGTGGMQGELDRRLGPSPRLAVVGDE